MEDKIRKNQDKSSADHTSANEKKDNAAKEQKGFDVSALWELVKKYKRYIASGVLFVAMVVILVKCTGPVTNTPKEPVADGQTAGELAQAEEFQINAIPEVNELISNYYTAYAAGNVATLEAIAQPISDTEKSYIQVFSQYVESYNNLSCYTKSGLNEGEYAVSVYLEMKFKDVQTAAPGLDFFYLRTNESGKLYIDNAYSQFNQSNMEESTQADVQALINEFEKAEDVLALQSEVEQKYKQAIETDEDLNRMANEIIPNTIKAWAEALKPADSAADQNVAQDEPSQNPTDETTTPDAETSEEEKPQEQDENPDGKAKTAYAKDGINLRKGAGTDTEVITQIPLGRKLKIYPDTKKDGWIKATYKGKKGYVKLEYVTTKKSKVPSGTDESAPALPQGKEITLSDSVNVRVSMSETADKVGLAYQGDTVKVIQSYAEGWTKVEWKGQTGYIKTELIK